MRVAQSFIFGHMAITVLELNGLYYMTSQNIYDGETVLVVSEYSEQDMAQYLGDYYTGFNC